MAMSRQEAMDVAREYEDNQVISRHARATRTLARAYRLTQEELDDLKESFDDRLRAALQEQVNELRCDARAVARLK